MPFSPTLLRRPVRVDRVVTVHYFEYSSSYYFEGERHDFWEFLYVDKGEVYVLAEGRETLLGRGSLIFHPPGEFHALRATGGSAPTQLLFDRRAFDDFRGKMFVRAGTYTAVVVADKEFSPDFSQWDPMDGRDFARPTLWVYGSFDVKENVFFTLGNASSDANVCVRL